MVIKALAVTSLLTLLPLGWLTWLAQVDLGGGNLEAILVQLPLVALVVSLTFKFIQWNDLSEQRWREYLKGVSEANNAHSRELAEMYQESVKAQREWYKSTLDLLMGHQAGLAEQVEKMAQQLAINSATLGERTKVDELIEVLAERRRET